MKLIIISGPSGSGKTLLSKLILKKIENGIILNTDNYYRTGIFSKIFSKIVNSYFDKRISFNSRMFKRDLKFILRNRFSKYSYKYNFKRKSIKKIYKNTKNIRFIIVEGIFSKEISKSFSGNPCIFIDLKTKKKICLKRVIKRDCKERGKSKYLAQKDFLDAWRIFYKNNKIDNARNYLKKFIVRNKSDLNYLLKKITKIMS